jgi:hypothetical protein
VTADDKQRILEKAKAGGFDDRHLASLETIIDQMHWTPEDDATFLATKIGEIIVERLRVEGVDYFPQLPNILMNASNLSWAILRDLEGVRGAVDVFRSINADAVKAALTPLSHAEGSAAKLADSLSQSSRLLLGEDLDEITKGEAAKWLTTSTAESSPKKI